MPLTQAEVDALGVEVNAVRVAIKVGDSIEVIDGPLAGVYGTVEGIDLDTEKVNVVVSMFGRETPAELDIMQVKLV